MPDISVLILTWNRKEDVVDALDSVRMQRGITYELVVVDSASTDDTQEVIRNRYPEVKYIRLPYNMGVIGGRNVGVANCSADLVFFLDDDAVLVEPDALLRVVEVFARRKDMWALTCRVLDIEGRLWRSLVYGDTTGSDNREMLASTFIGCACCVRNRAFQELGHLDQFYFREKEELEFSFRVYNSGRYILYFPGATVIHRINQTQRNPPGKIGYYKYRNEIITYFKHLPLFDAFLFSSWNFVADGLRALRQKWFPHFLLANLHLLYLVPVTFITERERISSGALSIIYSLKSESIVADRWPEIKLEHRGSLTKVVRAYIDQLSARFRP